MVLDYMAYGNCVMLRKLFSFPQPVNLQEILHMVVSMTELIT